MRNKLKNVEIYQKDGRRIARGTGKYKPHNIRDIKQMLEVTTKKYQNNIAFKYKKNGTLIKKTFVDFERDVNSLGTCLISMGLKGKRIAVIGENSYKWSVSYMSILNGVGVVVPLDKSLPQVEIENLIQRSGVEAIFYSKSYTDVMKNISNNTQQIKYYVNFEDGLDQDDSSGPG